jgi:hypothetical protein
VCISRVNDLIIKQRTEDGLGACALGEGGDDSDDDHGGVSAFRLSVNG